MIKNLTRQMSTFVTKKLKLDPNKYGYTKNGNTKLILVNKDTKEIIEVDKTKYSDLYF